MGTYLVTGIVHKLCVSIREIENRRLSLDLVKQALQTEIALENTIFSEDDSELVWHIKPSMLEGNFAEFLQAQFEMYDNTKEKEVKGLVTKINEATTGEKIIELAESKTILNFQMVDYATQFVQVGSFDGFTARYHLMAFFIDGKIIMECYNDILRYFEKNIRLQQSTYPVASCVKVLIAG